MKLLIIISMSVLAFVAADAQNYHPLDVCKWSYEQRAYETILPSLRHIIDKNENSGKFDANEYFGAVYLLCKIYTDYYKNPEYSVKVLENALKTIEHNADSTHLHAEAAYILNEAYLTTRQFDKAYKIVQNVDFIFDKARCNCDLRLFPKLEYLLETKNIAMLPSEITNVIKFYQEKGLDIFEDNDFMLIDRMAASYQAIGDTTTATKYWQHILDNIKITNSQYNSLFNSVINSLALIKMNHHQWHEALALYDRVKMFNDYYNIDYYKNILTCALFAKNIEKIKKYYILYSKEMVDNKSRIFFKTTEEVRYNSWLETVGNIELYNFAAIKSQMPVAIGDAFATSVFFKNISTQSNILLKNYIARSGNKNMISAYKRCQDLKQQILFSKENPDEKNRLFTEYTTLFDSILTQTQRLSQTIWNQIKTFGEIQRTLVENEYIIEFCLIPDYEQYPAHTDYFGAYIIGKNFSAPKLIKLAKVSKVEKLLTPTKDAEIFYSQIYSTEKSRQLYELIFKPLETTLRNARKIYYSPYGILSNVNFDYIADENGKYLGDKTNLVRVSSTAQIAQIKSRNITVAKTAVLFGNIDYKNTPKQTSNAAKRDIDFADLPFTKIEIDSIVKILNARNISTTIFEDTAANEQTFKYLSNRNPEILHLATHGFCLDTQEKAAGKPFAKNQNPYSAKESSMVLSGLALSGANNAWKGNFDPTTATEDGILTAYEISQLDLSNTKLVVLSACETARGKIFPVDGVFGLQRAFKQAGAGSILMSLWKVDDNATSMFMQQFYKHLFETNDRHKALKMAQDDTKKQFSDPYYWAAWVMLD